MIERVKNKEPPRLLAIMELGGYPNLTPLYKSLGFETEIVNSQRKARSYLKKRTPDVIVAEYNFQSDFRDRTSNLETLMARLQRHPRAKVVVFFQDEFRHKLDNLLSRFPVFEGVLVSSVNHQTRDLLQPFDGPPMTENGPGAVVFTLSEKRLSLTPNGNIRYPLKTPYRDGTCHLRTARLHRPARRTGAQAPGQPDPLSRRILPPTVEVAPR
jgi:hypothetical protein